MRTVFRHVSGPHNILTTPAMVVYSEWQPVASKILLGTQYFRNVWDNLQTPPVFFIHFYPRYKALMKKTYNTRTPLKYLKYTKVINGQVRKDYR